MNPVKISGESFSILNILFETKNKQVSLFLLGRKNQFINRIVFSDMKLKE